ncbi:hypothetical protein [Cellvibrio zantedeschiae]|nr:hypothetical protein [Cellvibrio zantedeschiae]
MSPLVVAEDSAEVKALKKGMPQDVAVLIERTVECNYWGGEDSSNKARAEKINQAMERLKCDALEKDHASIAKTYQNNYEVKVRMQKAKELF